MTYNVFGGTLNLAQSINLHQYLRHFTTIGTLLPRDRSLLARDGTLLPPCFPPVRGLRGWSTPALGGMFQFLIILRNFAYAAIVTVQLLILIRL